MVEYLIKDSKDLLNHISKWNLSVQKYPDNFPKDKIQPLPYTFNSVKDYREKIEPFFYLECWETLRKFAVSLREKRLNFEEKAVNITILNVEVSEDLESDDENINENENDLKKFEFGILMPNYFIYGYQGLHFDVNKRIDMERRSSGEIRKNDLLYIARVSKDLKEIYYETVVMSDITKEMDKSLISIMNRADLNQYTPVICTKMMTEKEIKTLRNELNNKKDKSIWICIHITTFGSNLKEFKSLDILSNISNLKIRQEITTGKCRNIAKLSDDFGNLLNFLNNDYNLSEHDTLLLVKIYKNCTLDDKESNDILNFLMNVTPDENGNIVINKDTANIFSKVNQKVSLSIEEKLLVFQKVLESTGQHMNNKLRELINNSNKISLNVKLNKTILEIIQQYQLNITQATVLAKVKNEKFLSLVEGPPGTGKTKMIVAFIYQELRENQRKKKKTKILVCAPSNAACNEVARRLKKENVNTKITTARYVTEEYLDSTISHISIDKFANRKLYHQIVTKHKFFETAIAFNVPEETLNKLTIHNENILSKTVELVKKRKELNICMSPANTRKKNNQLLVNKLYQELCLIENDLDYYIQIFIDNLLLIEEEEFYEFKNLIVDSMQSCKQEAFNEADVIVTTLTGSSNMFIRNIKDKISLLIVDEASQATELTTLIPLTYDIPKAILIGDSKQLPPTVIHNDAKNNNYGRSLFERLQYNSPESVHLLDIQYRMHPMISTLSSKCFYENAIVNGENVKSKKWQKSWFKNPDFGPLVFYNVKGIINKDDSSLTNMKEANEVLNIIKNLLNAKPSLSINTSISVISPYRAQVFLIRKKLKLLHKDNLDRFSKYQKEIQENQEAIQLTDEGKELLKKINILENINVNTVDSFQGQESDIVILSCVRSGTRSLGFLTDKRRLNVSITRARFSLIIFGDSQTLSKDKYWKRIIDDIKKVNCFKTIS